MENVTAMRADMQKFLGTDFVCHHRLRKTNGLPCYHELVYPVVNETPIPLDSIHQFWKTLTLVPNDVKESHTELESVLCRIQAHFKMTSSNAVRKQILGQLDAIAHSKKRFANVTEPAVVVSTRGRSSRTKRLPSAFEIAKKKAKRSKGKESTKAIPIGNNSRKSSNEVTIVEAKDPKIAGLEQRIRDSYESRTDVQGDGNCGFRVVEHFAMGNKKLWSQV